MRRSLSLLAIFSLVALGLAACSHDDLATVPDTGNADDFVKRPPAIYDPPPELDLYLQALLVRFDSLDWIVQPVQLDLSKTGTVEVQPAGYEPIRIEFTPNPDTPLAAGEDPSYTFNLYVPQAPSGGYLYTPGNSMLFKTRFLPSAEFGDVKIDFPVMGFYDTSDYTGAFDFATIYVGADSYAKADVLTHIVVPDWPNPKPGENVVTVPLKQLIDKDPSSATERVLDPEYMGDEG